MRQAILGTISALFFLSGCETARATSMNIPKERVTECEQVCTNVGLKLAAFVVMMSSAGCVCEPKTASAVSAPSAGAAAASGGTTIAAAAAAAGLASQKQQQADSYVH